MIFVLISRGWGILIVLIAIAAIAIAVLAAYALHTAGGATLALFGAVLALAGVPTYLLGKRLNRPPSESVAAPVDPRTTTGWVRPEDTGFRSRHSLFFVPFQWWGPIFVVVGAFFLYSSLR